MEERIDIGIIIPFYNGIKYFDKLFESINEAKNQLDTKYKLSIILVDNSKSNNLQFFKTYMENIIYLREAENLGYGKACNVGYRYCKNNNFKLILITNQDGYLDKYCLLHLINVMNSDKQVAITSSLPLTYDSKQIEPFFIKYYLQFVPDLVTDRVINKIYKSKGYEITKIPGVCFLFRLDGVFQELNLFDEKFYMYFEDEDLCKRVLDLNQKILLMPDAIFYHQHTHTTDKNNAKDIQFQNEISGQLYRIKHSENKYKAIYGLVIDNIFDGCKRLFRGDFRNSLKSFKILGKVLKIYFK
jgi:GT2 family glycosyltransferase